MNKIVLFIILLLMPALVHAQDAVSAFDDSGRVIINEELRQSSAGIRNLKGQIADLLPIDLASSSDVSGILPIANGGTGGTGGGVPQGVIAMWSGTIASIPTGWELSDGSCSITCPDLRNRFIVGADADVSSVAKSTITGTALQYSDTGVFPEHDHDLRFKASTAVSASASGNYFTGYYEPVIPTDHPLSVIDTYDRTATASVVAAGTGTENIAVFYALAFIIKN